MPAAARQMNAPAPLLHVHEVAAGYGAGQVLFGPSLQIAPGQAVSLLGRNGMGKTTLVKCIFGLLPLMDGRIVFDGADISRWPAARRARAGLGLVPEGRQIFPGLTVEENLLAFARPVAGGWTWERVQALFPELQARRHAAGALLSGGEQQMLAIGRALMTNPRLLVLDEATEGLSPRLRQRIWQALAEIRAHGVALLVIDKHLDALLHLCDEHHIMVKGRIAWSGNSKALAADATLRQKFLGV